jgi:hypothetical protein
MGVKIQLFEVGGYRSEIFLWGWMKREVYKEKANKRDELVARIMNRARTPRRPQEGYTYYCQES